MKVQGIYLIRNLTNNKVYIGQSVNIYWRWEVHKRQLTTGTHTNQHLQRAWKKCGESKFEFVVVKWCRLINLLDKEERRIIKKYNSTDERFGYNKTYGGGGTRGYKHTLTTRLKIGKAALGNKHMLGRKLSKKTIDKIVAKTRGLKRNRAFRERLREVATGRKHTQETKEKLRLANLGHTTSDTTKAKLRDKALKQWRHNKEFRDKMEVVLKTNRINRWKKEKQKWKDKLNTFLNKNTQELHDASTDF